MSLHPTSSPLKVTEGDRGLELRTRNQPLDSLANPPKELYGLVAQVSEEDFDALVEAKYPSLYETGGSVMGILFGPLSLVNHSCAAKFRFSNLTTRGHPEGFEGFGVIRLKDKRGGKVGTGTTRGTKRGGARGRSQKRDREEHVEEEEGGGEEILVNYGMRKKGFICSCPECAR